MKLISRLRGRCFCAFCKAERKVYVKKHVDLTNVVGAVLLAMTAGQAYWGAPDPRAILVFCLVVTGMEIFVYMRWRSSIVCALCGFDPLVYKQSPARASELVKAFYKEREEDPSFWLTRSPLLERQKAARLNQRKAAKHKVVAARADHKRQAGKALPATPPQKVSQVASLKSP